MYREIFDEDTIFREYESSLGSSNYFPKLENSLKKGQEAFILIRYRFVISLFRWWQKKILHFENVP